MCIKLLLKFVNSFSAVTIVGCDPVQVISNLKEHLLNFWLQGEYSSSRPLHGYSWQEPCVHLQPLHQHHRQLRFVCIALYLRTIMWQKCSFLRFSRRLYWSIQPWKILFSDKVQVRRYRKLFRIVFLIHKSEFQQKIFQQSKLSGFIALSGGCQPSSLFVT